MMAIAIIITNICYYDNDKYNENKKNINDNDHRDKGKWKILTMITKKKENDNTNISKYFNDIKSSPLKF